MSVVDQHAAPPAICTECLARLFAAAGATAGSGAQSIHCEHRGPGSLCRVEVRAGRITSWLLTGPVTHSQAKAIGELVNSTRLGAKGPLQ